MKLTLPGEIEVVRIPELPEHTSIPTFEDYIPVWIAEENKTRKIPISTFRMIFEPTGTDTYVPVQLGGNLLYVVPPEKEGDNFVSIPQLAGKNFTVRRDMMPLVPEEDFLALSLGGFMLLEDTLIAGQKFELQVFELSDGTIPGGGFASGYINGKVVVNTNHNITPEDAGKVHQLRGGDTSLVVTLPDINLVAENSTYIIESIAGSNKQHRIDTSSSQYIYLNGESRQNIYIGKGEKIQLFRDSDGWYLIDGEKNYLDIGKPSHDYKVRLNHFVAQGQLVNRSDYPRLWAEVQTFGSSLVSDSTWLSSPNYKGCYSTGNGSTTFRIPNLLNSAFRGLKNIGGSDSERVHNHAGGFQENQNKQHSHVVEAPAAVTSTTDSGWGRFVGGNDNFEPSGMPPFNTGNSGGAEARMDNIGLIPQIKY